MSGCFSRSRRLCNKEACQIINASSMFCNSALLGGSRGSFSNVGMPLLNMKLLTRASPKFFRKMALIVLRCFVVRALPSRSLYTGFYSCASVRSFVKISSANARKEAVLSASACSVAVLSASTCPLAVLIVSEWMTTLLHYSLKLCSLAWPSLWRVMISHIRLCSNSSGSL